MHPISVRQVNSFLVSQGYGAYKLVHGKGYYYFAGGSAMQWKDSSVMVFNVSQLSLDQWLEELRWKIKEYTDATKNQ